MHLKGAVASLLEDERLENEIPKSDFSSAGLTSEQAKVFDALPHAAVVRTISPAITATEDARVRMGYPFARVPLKDVTLLTEQPLVVPEPIMLYMRVGFVEEELPGNESEAIR